MVRLVYFRELNLALRPFSILVIRCAASIRRQLEKEGSWREKLIYHKLAKSFAGMTAHALPRTKSDVGPKADLSANILGAE
jgi:hypothetical protein